ncbi:MAG TPA: alpha/beta hydrolase [Xanthobacteraceae bacterium]|nr:alpha/beta hydrolase [Xanthobacteraceae bacterium]
MQAINVTTPDGLSLAAQAWGNPQGREILFIHGFNQAHLAWLRQVGDPDLAQAFRMVTFDLRGHGASDKPADKERYAADVLWGDDVAAVMDATGLVRPVIVAWSYGGRVLADYLRTHGAGRIAGINYVSARTVADPAMFGPGRQNYPNMQSDDLAANIAGTRGFVRACFARPPAQDDFEVMLAFNMVVPPHVRSHVLGRPQDTPEVLARIACPVLVTHGTADPVLLASMGEYTASRIKDAKLSLYEGVGHTPFWEDTARFNRELAAFVSATR